MVMTAFPPRKRKQSKKKSKIPLRQILAALLKETAWRQESIFGTDRRAFLGQSSGYPKREQEL